MRPTSCVGTYLGAAGDPAITRLVEDADALLLLGVILSDTNFALSQRRLDPRRTMLAFDREVRVGHHVYPDVPIEELIDALVARARPLGSAARVNRPAVELSRAGSRPTTSRSRPPTSPPRSTTCSTATAPCR